jgi:tetratricopeptide (TPR) repeat protein
LGRYEIHEVLRQYAIEKLDELPEDRDQVRRRHAEYYLHLADEPGLPSEDQAKQFERLEREHDNLRAVLQWARDNKEVEIGLRLGGALSRFWFVRGYYSEGREALAAALESSSLPTFQPSNAFRAKALRGAGDLDRAMGDYASARSLYEESLAIHRELGNKRDIAVALVRVAMIPWEQGDHVLARSLYEESLAISRELGDKKDIAIALANLGLMAFETGDYPTARALLEESLTLDRGDKFSLAIRLNNLGNVALMQGDYAGARALHMEGMALRRELGDKWGIAVSLIGLGGAAVLTGDAERGARVLGAADALLTAIGARLEADDRIPYEHGVAYARARLDEGAFARAWAEGRAISMEQAIEYALGGNGSD